MKTTVSLKLKNTGNSYLDIKSLLLVFFPTFVGNQNKIII